MKYQTAAAFENHLSETFPGHIAPCYVIVSPCDFERRLMLGKIITLLQKKESSAQLIRVDALESCADAVLDRLSAPSLFSPTTLVVVDPANHLKEIGKLAPYLEKPAQGTYLLMGALAFKPLSELYQKGKKVMVVLDLSDEKPWERERRLRDWIVQEAKKEGKMLQADAAAALMENIGADMPGLYQELQKLLCYAAEKTVITRGDVEKVSVKSADSSGWQLAEAVIWRREGIGHHHFLDPSFFFLFLGQLRYSLTQGAQIQDLLTQKRGAEIGKHLPNLRPQMLDKLIPQASRLPPRYFEKALSALFQMELDAKSSALDQGLLLERFIGKLRIL